MTVTHTDVLIIGAGPAGLAAAVALRRGGVRDLVVVEREAEAGGTPRQCDHLGFGWQDRGRLMSGPAYARRLVEEARSVGVQLHLQTSITGWVGPSTLAYTSPDGLGEIEARAIVLATGCRERPRSARLVPGARPAGVFTTGSLQRFVYEQRLPVGRRAVIIGAELVSLSALLTLRHAGVKTIAFVDEQPRPQLYFPYNLARTLFADVLSRTPIRTRARVTAILGHKRVEAVEVTHVDTGQVEQIACDTVVFTGGWIPEHTLARQGGLMLDAGSRGPRVDGAFRTSRQGVFAVGNLLRGVETAGACALEGWGVASRVQDFLKTGAWPSALPVRVESPLLWVCPNAFDPLLASSELCFRSAEFRADTIVRIAQGERILASQRFKRLIVNETLSFTADGLHRADPAGEGLRITVGPA